MQTDFCIYVKGYLGALLANSLYSCGYSCLIKIWEYFKKLNKKFNYFR